MRTKKTSIRLEKGLRLFKPSYTVSTGEKRPVSDWWIEFRDHEAKPRRVAAFADRDSSAELARKLRKLVGWKVSGELPDAALTRWMETMPDKLRDRLAKIGLLDARHVAATKPLADHLDDWKASLIAKGNTLRHAELVTSRARRVFEGCRFGHWSELSASRVQTYLASLREDTDDKRGISSQTYNFYLQAVKQFCGWMVKDRRAAESPLAHLQALSVRADRRHDRRALSVDEVVCLLDSTANGPDRFGITGEQRAMLYRTAIETGLRQNELRSLTRASFDFDGEAPTVTISAASAKNRQQRTLPLANRTAEALRAFLSGKLPAAKAFAIPPRQHVAKMLRADLEAAREAWLAEAKSPEEQQKREESDFLRYCDSRGLYADFHALRHTRGVWLFEQHKASPREVQELMRVSSLALVDRYTRSFKLTDTGLVERGPDLSPKPESNTARATGTDGKPHTEAESDLACFLARFDGKSGNGRSQDAPKPKATKSEKPLKNRGFESGEGEIRTQGELQKSAFLIAPRPFLETLLAGLLAAIGGDPNLLQTLPDACGSTRGRLSESPILPAVLRRHPAVSRKIRRPSLLAADQ